MKDFMINLFKDISKLSKINIYLNEKDILFNYIKSNIEQFTLNDLMLLIEDLEKIKLDSEEILNIIVSHFNKQIIIKEKDAKSINVITQHTILAEQLAIVGYDNKDFWNNFSDKLNKYFIEVKDKVIDLNSKTVLIQGLYVLSSVNYISSIKELYQYLTGKIESYSELSELLMMYELSFIIESDNKNKSKEIEKTILNLLESFPEKNIKNKSKYYYLFLYKFIEFNFSELSRAYDLPLLLIKIDSKLLNHMERIRFNFLIAYVYLSNPFEGNELVSSQIDKDLLRKLRQISNKQEILNDFNSYFNFKNLQINSRIKSEVDFFQKHSNILALDEVNVRNCVLTYYH